MQRSIPFNKYTPEVTITQNGILTDKLFHELKEKVYARRPMLKEIVEKHGDLSLFEYAKRYNEPNTAMQNHERRTEFVTAFSTEVKKLLGNEIAESVKKQLISTYRVTTTDHHGPLSVSTMTNSNIHETLPNLNGDDIVKNILILGCSNVSFDNTSFPRGLLFHSEGKNGVSENQLAFYPRSVRPRPLIYFDSYTTQNLESTYKRIEELSRDKTISENVSLRLKTILNEIYADSSVLSCKYFSEQVTKTNFMLWKKIMKDYPHSPNLIYIEQEAIVNKLLDNYHLDQPTIINKLLFSPKYHKLLLKHFDGIIRGFSTKEKIGTYLFWALPQGQKYRVQLWKQGKYLQTEDGSYKIELTPEGLRKAILKKELIPSTLMSFIILAFYYGVRLVGGKDQTTYLTQMKKAFHGMQKEFDNSNTFEYIDNLRTTDLSITFNSLAYIRTGLHDKVPATSIDLLLYGDRASFTIMSLLSKVLTVKEILFRGLVDYYKFVYKESEQEAHLTSISKEDLEKYLGMDRAIKTSLKTN